jgi:surface antigen
MQASTRLGLLAGAFFTVAAAALICSTPASAASQSDSKTKSSHHQTTSHASAKHTNGSVKQASAKSSKRRYAGGGGISCVPYARAASGITLAGNAANWWDAASGVYDRGSRPEPGAVLNFRANSHMRLGHVAVVSTVLSSREIEIDHANWNVWGYTRGGVSRGVRVVDVSPTNNWSAVRVELGHSGDFGSVYPTYGFIYDRPDSGTLIANNLTTMQPTRDRPALVADEVAEMPAARTAAASAPQVLILDGPAHSLH